MNAIKQARLAAGLTQKAMSERLNIPLRTIENWEGGKNEPPAWAEALIEEKLMLIKEENEMKYRIMDSVITEYEEQDEQMIQAGELD